MHECFQLRLPLAVGLVEVDPVGGMALRPARLAQADCQDDFGVGGFGFVELPVQLAEVILPRRLLDITPVADQAELLNADVEQGVHGLLRVDAEALGVIRDEADAELQRLRGFGVDVPPGDAVHRADQY